MKPTTIAEIENRKKKEEPSRPNSFGSSFSSVMMGTAARPTTILSAKFTSMNRNSRNVMVQAPFGVSLTLRFGISLDVACAAMILPRHCRSARLPGAYGDATHGLPGKATGHFDSGMRDAAQLRNAA